MHTKGERFDTSTILFLPKDADMPGWVHCSHAHCQNHDLRDVLAVFTRAELARARQEAGLPTVADASRAKPYGFQVIHRVHDIRTVPAREVAAWRA
jgi:hypothetical protein